jgi:prepilin-type N-terminal cleavage/methylation domain-containing protein
MTRRAPRTDARPVQQPPADRGGFTIVELVVSLVILTVGLLAFAGTTIVLIRQVTAAGLATERATAVQTVVEGLRALPYDSIGAGSDSIGSFRITWTSTAVGASKEIRVISSGPGPYGPQGGLRPGVADTFSTRILEP